MLGDINLLSNVSSLALTVQEWRCFKYIFTKDDLINQSPNYIGRTAPATLGMLNNWKTMKGLNCY